MPELVDYSGGYPGAAAVKRAGFAGAIRYLTNSPDRGLNNKKITRAEADDYKANGLALVSNWQKGKGDSADFKVGDPYQTGVSMGKAALAEHFAVGGSGWTPIYFSVDEDVTLETWNNRVLPWLEGIASVIGKEWVGVYGGQRSMWWAEEDGFRWRWQTLGWSRYDANGNWNNSLPVQWVPGVNIQQYEIDKSNINGVGIDRNRTMTADYGQWGLSRASKGAGGGSDQVESGNNTSTGGVVSKPNYPVIDMWSDANSNRFGASISNILGHTQEAPDSTQPEDLARYLQNVANEVSYHDVIGKGRLVRVVPANRACWAVLDANPYTYNICFSGSRASMSRAEWLAREIDIRIFAWRAIEISRAYNVGTDVIAPPYVRKRGISDHKYVTECLGIGTHTDLGPNFPWDKLAQFVREYLNGAAVKPVVNMINQEYERAKGWIGDVIDKTEQKARGDGKGRYRRFSNGIIYWHPTTGAHAVPGRLLETYARYDYENGFLGFPVGDHTVLKDKDGKIIGGVQGFQGAAIYRREGDDPGYAVGGDIRNMWNRSGFENGPYGFPIGDEKEIISGIRAQQFQNALLVWAPGKVVPLKAVGGPDEILAVY